MTVGRTNLDIRLIVGDDVLHPTILGASDKGVLYVILRLPGLGAHFSNHGGQREHIRMRNLEREWRINRDTSAEERERLRDRFAYEASGDHVVYMLPLREAAKLGDHVIDLDARTNTLDIELEALLEEFPYDAVDGVKAQDLDGYLATVGRDRYLGLDYGGGRILVAWRGEGGWQALGLPLETETLEGALEDTTFHEGLVEPLWGSAEVILEHIAADQELTQQLQMNAGNFTDVFGAISEEIYARLERQVGVTYHPEG